MYLFIYSLMKYCHFGISVCVWFSLSVIHSLFTGLINSSVHSGVFVLFFPELEHIYRKRADIQDNTNIYYGVILLDLLVEPMHVNDLWRRLPELMVVHT